MQGASVMATAMYRLDELDELDATVRDFEGSDAPDELREQRPQIPPSGDAMCLHEDAPRLQTAFKATVLTTRWRQVVAYITIL